MVKVKNNTSSQIFLFSNNRDIIESIITLEKINVALKVGHLSFKNHKMSSKNIYIVDDSVLSFIDILKYHENNLNGNIFLLSKNSNLALNSLKKIKIFYKPFKIFSLYKEILQTIDKKKIYYRDWYLEKNKLIIKHNNRTIKLTEKEYDLINLLACNPDKIYNKNTLLKKIWKLKVSKNDIETRVLESLVSRIRKKIKISKKGPSIENTKGGYKIKI